MPDPLLWPDPTATLTRIARVAGVGRAAVTTWRHHPDFPHPVAGTEQSPHFDPADTERWLYRHGKIGHYEPPAQPPATLTLPDGTTVTLHDAHLRRADGLVELGGYTTPPAWVPLQDAALARVQVTGLPDVTVTSATADISDHNDTRHISLIWREENQHTLTAQA
ncbi:hypothetical protein [Kitasatospora sp. NPDC006786]|uniref:hypothetical protein n=1 Tax=unclassified Kitasatospora TaxID=2633591 RepID=UPI0033FF06E1